MTPDWLPGNEVDADLVGALADDDRPRFFRAIRRARWYLPALPPDGDVPRYLTRDLAGTTYLVVFTSPGSLAATVGGVARGCLITGYDELSAYWPDPAWRLAVNPGTPVDAWVTLDFLADAAAGRRPIPSAADARRPVTPPEPVVDAVLDEFLRRLVTEPLLVPVGGARFEVFTSADALAARYPAGVETITTTLPELLATRAGDPADLVVDPGSETPLTVAASDVPGLLLWTGPDPRRVH